MSLFLAPPLRLHPSAPLLHLPAPLLLHLPVLALHQLQDPHLKCNLVSNLSNKFNLQLPPGLQSHSLPDPKLLDLSKVDEPHSQLSQVAFHPN